MIFSPAKLIGASSSFGCSWSYVTRGDLVVKMEQRV